jgi:hypothetical protein
MNADSLIWWHLVAPQPPVPYVDLDVDLENIIYSALVVLFARSIGGSL